MFTCQLSNNLIVKGHQVMIVSLFEGKAELPFNGDIFSLDASLKSRFLDVAAWRKLSKIVVKFKPDIIQANAGDTLKYAVFSKKMFGWKAPIVSRNASEVGRYLKSPIQKKLNSFFYKNVEFVISVSQASKNDILIHFPFLSERTTVIPVGLEPKTAIFEVNLLPNNCKHIVHVGGFTFEKNHDGILRIFQDVLKVKKNIHLHLVGDGPLKNDIQNRVIDLGLENRISFYGFVNNPLSYIKSADVFILPSIIEGLPAVILESMFCDVPVIAYNVGGISEILKNKDTGYLIEKNEEEEFADVLKNVLDVGIDVEILQNAKEMVSKKFSNDIITDQFLKYYSEVSNTVNSLTKSKLKILHIVTKRQYRGAELFAAYLSDELIKLGHEVVFLGLYENTGDILSVQGADNRDLVSSKNGKFSFEIVDKIIKLVRETKPDIIQCNGSDTLKYTVVASLFFRDIPLIYRNISIISEWISNGPKKVLYKKMFQRIDHVTSVGDEAMADFIRTYEYPEEKTEVIRRGIPFKEVNKLKLYNAFRRSLGISEDSKIAIHIGNFSPEKNHNFLIDVFSKLKKSNSNIKLVFVGTGSLLDDIKDLVFKRGLSQSIFFLGFRKDIAELISASDCLVLCSKIEGVPGVILEAGTQKIPAISTNVGGVSEILIDGKTGYLIDNFDQEDYAEKLIELMGNPELRDYFGTNAFNLISKGFNPEKNARKFEQLYYSLINPSK